MKRLILNIGLTRDGVAYPAHEAMEALANHDMTVVGAPRVLRWNDEPTLVATVDTATRDLDGALHWLSVGLDQECVAAFEPKTGAGALYGPRREAWGGFDPHQFLLADGTRLGAQLATA